ncbi:MAG: hypothetical protein O3C04_03600 [Crenarchaeota archaeon]|nr:hypothetical protein [Thermoproteota archaeon]
MHFYENGKRIAPNDMLNKYNIEYCDQLNQNHNGLCKGKCSQFRASRPIYGNRYTNGQLRCQICQIFLTEMGVDNFRCKCCNFKVRSKPRNRLYKEKYRENVRNVNDPWIKKESDDRNWWLEDSTKKRLEEQKNNDVKKSTPIYEETDNSIKTYYEFKEFLNSKIDLETNYQLIILKELLEYGKLHKGEIADSLAYFNNKDSSDINSVKYYLDVPVYDILLNHEFVTVDYRNKIPYYTINVTFTNFQKLELLEYLQNSLRKYNEEHNIPDNEHPDADNVGSINWKESNHMDLIITNSTSLKSFWVWSVTPANWEILKIKNVWGSRIVKEKISEVVKPGDLVAFYVIGTNSFKGVYEFVGNWYNSPGKIWDDDLEPTGELRHKSQIKIIPICNGDAKLSELHAKMELFKDKPTNICNLILQGGNGYPSNNHQSLTTDDFNIIIDELNNSSQIEYVALKTQDQIDKKIHFTPWAPQNSKTRYEIIKCPHCHTTISGILNSEEFNNQIEEKFGFKQRDPNDKTSKIPQLYCRKCRTQNTEENKEIDIHSHDESQDFKPVKIFESNSDSISIKHCNVISTEIIQKDQQLTNDDLMRIFGVGNMGGIRYSSKNNVIILCDTKSGHYDDMVDKDFQIIHYTGEGQKGDQTLRGGNQRIVNSKMIPMFYFIEVPQKPDQKRREIARIAREKKLAKEIIEELDELYLDLAEYKAQLKGEKWDGRYIYKFVGRVKYTKHVFKTENDVNGTPRQVIKFLLEVVE